MVWSSGQEVRHKAAIPAKLTRAIHRRRRALTIEVSCLRHIAGPLGADSSGAICCGQISSSQALPKAATINGRRS